jgi:hypothetical protein
MIVMQGYKAVWQVEYQVQEENGRKRKMKVEAEGAQERSFILFRTPLGRSNHVASNVLSQSNDNDADTRIQLAAVSGCKCRDTDDRPRQTMHYPDWHERLPRSVYMQCDGVAMPPWRAAGVHGKVAINRSMGREGATSHFLLFNNVQRGLLIWQLVDQSASTRFNPLDDLYCPFVR